MKKCQPTEKDKGHGGSPRRPFLSSVPSKGSLKKLMVCVPTFSYKPTVETTDESSDLVNISFSKRELRPGLRDREEDEG